MCVTISPHLGFTVSSLEENLHHGALLFRLTICTSSSPSHKSSTFSQAEQRSLAAYRVHQFLSNPEHYHVQHRHASSQEGIRAHTNIIESRLKAFDDTMKQESK
jgi:hypothetical protein